MSGSMVKEVAVRRHPFDAARWTLIETAFQPIVDIRTAAVFGYEALMRGHDRIGFADPSPLSTRPSAPASCSGSNR